MFDLFLTEPFVPFTLSLALLFGLLMLEIALSFIGGTLLGMGADADVDLDMDLANLGDFDLGIDASDLMEVELVDVDADYDVAPASATSVGPASWLGFGRVPFIIWIAALLLGFGLAGLVLQQLASALLGWPLRDWIYTRVARNRFALFGRTDLCSIPDPRLKARLIGTS